MKKHSKKPKYKEGSSQYQMDRLYERDGGVCWICNTWGPVIAFNRDHLIPRSLGGPDGLWNLRLTHPRCNLGRNRLAPPLREVLRYCSGGNMRRRAKRLFEEAYPEMSPEGEVIDIPLRTKFTRSKVEILPGPTGHKRHKSQVCEKCKFWCGSCQVCWCTAQDQDHDIIRIRSSGGMRELYEMG